MGVRCADPLELPLLRQLRPSGRRGSARRVRQLRSRRAGGGSLLRRVRSSRRADAGSRPGRRASGALAMGAPPPAPAPPDVECPRCGTPYAPHQEYCLECGLRLPTRGVVTTLATGWRRRVRWYPGDWIWSALAGLVVAAIATAVVVAATWGNGGGSTIVATGPARTGSVTTVGTTAPIAPPAEPTTAPAPPAPPSPPPAATSGPISWPAGKHGF